MFTDLIKSNTSHWLYMHSFLSYNNNYIKYSISIYHKQNKCI
jgi:hypothetical protein